MPKSKIQNKSLPVRQAGKIQNPTLDLFGKTILISICAHLSMLGMFTFSFGLKIPAADYGRVSFWGASLRKSDFSVIPAKSRMMPAEKSGFINTAVNNKSVENILLANPSFKPRASLGLEADKVPFIQKTTSIAPAGDRKGKKEIVLYPSLPHQFMLYFKDRQVAHIELVFNILSKGAGRAGVLVRRKVSSGNLEADLLSMRYINHYLLIQHAAFIPNNWQSVKIDLSAKK